MEVGQTAEYARLVVRRTGNGQQRTVRCQYLIGADGANSIVREAIGSGREDKGFEADWLVIDVLPNEGVTLDIPAARLPASDGRHSARRAGQGRRPAEPPWPGRARRRARAFRRRGGTGFVLISRSHRALSAMGAAVAAALRQLNARAAVIVPAGADAGQQGWEDLDGKFLPFMEQHGIETMLVRPDSMARLAPGGILRPCSWIARRI